MNSYPNKNTWEIDQIHSMGFVEVAGATKILHSSCVIGQGQACLYLSFSYGSLYTQFSHFLLANFTLCSFPALLFLQPILHIHVTRLPMGPAQMKPPNRPGDTPSH